MSSRISTCFAWMEEAQSNVNSLGIINVIGKPIIFLSDTVLGEKDLYIRAELYSYGSAASSGGAMTNTAQFLRHRYNGQYDTQTFKLNVCYENGGA